MPGKEHEHEELASALESPVEYSFGLLCFCFQISLIIINSSYALIRFWAIWDEKLSLTLEK